MTDSSEWIVVPPVGGKVRISGLGPLDGESDGYRPGGWIWLADHMLPRVMEIISGGDGSPEVYSRVEISESGPKLVELRFTSTDPAAEGIRQADLRAVHVSKLLEDFPPLFTGQIFRYPDGKLAGIVEREGEYGGARKSLGDLRGGRTTRNITPQLLEKVASIYRANISRYPTKAVQHHFQVSQRTAAEYVSRARKRGLLPPTKKGKKQA